MEKTSMEKTSIAAALRRLAVVKGRLGEALTRASSVFAVRSDEQPAFEFKALSEEADGLREELIRLKAAIASANATARIEHNGKTMLLAEAILRLAEIKGEIGWLKGLAVRTGVETIRERVYDSKLRETVEEKHELMWTSAFSETDKLVKIRSLEDEFQALNLAVETANHTTLI